MKICLCVLLLFLFSNTSLISPILVSKTEHEKIENINLLNTKKNYNNKPKEEIDKNKQTKINMNQTNKKKNENKVVKRYENKNLKNNKNKKIISNSVKNKKLSKKLLNNNIFNDIHYCNSTKFCDSCSSEKEIERETKDYIEFIKKNPEAKNKCFIKKDSKKSSKEKKLRMQIPKFQHCFLHKNKTYGFHTYQEALLTYARVMNKKGKCTLSKEQLDRLIANAIKYTLTKLNIKACKKIPTNFLNKSKLKN